MTVEKVIITNGLIVGAIINDNNTEKRARLTDLQKLLEKGKITAGARLINNEIFLDSTVLKNKAAQPIFELDSIIKDDNGDATAISFTNGKQADIKTAWGLAADDRVKGLQAAYMKDIDSKVIMSV